MIPLAERLKSKSAQWDRKLLALSRGLRVATPAIVQSFDPVKQTVTVQPAITEVMLVAETDEGVPVPKPIKLPLLQDVPVSMPRGGSMALTMPVKAGDECLVVFTDSCIDSWFQSGGVGNQIANRRHSLSDGIAIFGPWSQPRALSNYSTSSAQLRSEDGSTFVEVATNTVNVMSGSNGISVGPNGISLTYGGNTITMGSAGISINGTAISVTAGGQTKIENRVFLAHDHTGGTITPGGLTGPVV